MLRHGCDSPTKAYLSEVTSRSPRPQKGNPHGLTLNQHVFPRASVARFAGGGVVDLLDFGRGIRRPAKPTDPILCADRVWAHGSESGWMKKMEDLYQGVAERTLQHQPDRFNADETDVIGDFYALWQARAERRHLPMQIIEPHESVIATRVTYTADELEQLEKNGIAPFRGDGAIDMRHLMGPVIRLATMRIRGAMRDRTWSLRTTREGEFCVPDVPAHGIIPLAPTVALDSSRAGVIGPDELAEINAVMASGSRQYLFARNLDHCPGLASKVSSC